MWLYLLSFHLLPFSPATPAQPVWSEAELAMANTAGDIDYLTAEEKKVIMLINLARLDGTRYLQTYFRQYNDTPYAQMAASSNTYLVSLQKDMAGAKNLPMLQPDKGLFKAARYHAKDSGEHGLVGHTSSDGTTMGKRLPKYVEGWQKIAENCSYGYNEAVNIVGQLLLDEDVPGLGHRKNILNPNLEFIGVAIAPHSIYRFNCVMDFCARFDD